ncbi:MAG: acyl-[acyl-carrier-protein] thioesterase [Dysgonamonadaceae bacterium]|jgi:acyl-ACP thioesterase|nr:acyl-[acyl-carrier-protein] thioesterase [Dysgonamonadaceae bacterium]
MNVLEKTGSFKFHIESYVCDFTEKATLPVICNFILDAASIHAQQRGFGYEQISKDHVAWVLSRLSVEMYEYPSHNQDLTVETWVESVNHFFTQRCFRFIDHSGKTIGYARSIWAAISIATRRPIDIPAWRPDMLDFVTDENACPVEKMSKIPAVAGEDPSMGYSVRYSDIDINRHMNSVKYIEHVINVFDLDIFKEKTIHKFEIVYLAEGSFGDKLKLYKQTVSADEYLIDTRRGDESVCRSRIIWKENKQIKTTIKI